MKIGAFFPKSPKKTYIEMAEEAIAQVGGETVNMGSSDDTEAVIAKVKRSDIDILIAQGHRSHQGFRVAQAVLEAGIPVVVISGVRPDFYTGPKVREGETDNLIGIINLVRFCQK